MKILTIQPIRHIRSTIRNSVKLSKLEKDMEIWVPIPVAQGYWLSTMGRIRYKKFTIVNYKNPGFKWRILHPTSSYNTFLKECEPRVYIQTYKGKTSKVCLSTLMRKTFNLVPPGFMPGMYKKLIYKDGNRFNNRLSNLIIGYNRKIHNAPMNGKLIKNLIDMIILRGFSKVTVRDITYIFNISERRVIKIWAHYKSGIIEIRGTNAYINRQLVWRNKRGKPVGTEYFEI